MDMLAGSSGALLEYLIHAANNSDRWAALAVSGLRRNLSRLEIPIVHSWVPAEWRDSHGLMQRDWPDSQVPLRCCENSSEDERWHLCCANRLLETTIEETARWQILARRKLGCA